jgi:hypothetical protein
MLTRYSRRQEVVIYLSLICLVYLWAAYFGVTTLGNPRLAIEITAAPSWSVLQGETLQLAVRMTNTGWELTWAKDVHLTVTLPAGVNGTATTRRVESAGSFRGGATVERRFNATIDPAAPPSTYNVTVELTGANVVAVTYHRQVDVRQRAWYLNRSAVDDWIVRYVQRSPVESTAEAEAAFTAIMAATPLPTRAYYLGGERRSLGATDLGASWNVTGVYPSTALGCDDAQLTIGYDVQKNGTAVLETIVLTCPPALIWHVYP